MEKAPEDKDQVLSTSNEPQCPDRKNNRLLTRLDAGEFILGLTLTSNNLELAVSGAKLGFHFLWVEMEHSPISLETLREIVLATCNLPAAVLARVPITSLWAAKRVLDQGVSGVIFPFVSTAELAQIAAQACRYPPAGRRGSGAGLAAATWFETGSYYDSADVQILTICVIEEEQAVANIDAIAATPGVDVLFIGTSDLSFSLGLRGRQREPKLWEAIETIKSAAKRHRKFLGCPAQSAEDVTRLHAEGFQVFQSAAELGLMRLGARQILEPLGLIDAAASTGMLY
jgi:2-keto-3-deoxy-L-rhamnonate aldolase RhmA